MVNGGEGEARAGELASPGNGTVAHLTGELFQAAASVKTQRAAYKGANQALTDVIGGAVDLSHVVRFPRAGQIRSGQACAR